MAEYGANFETSVGTCPIFVLLTFIHHSWLSHFPLKIVDEVNDEGRRRRRNREILEPSPVGAHDCSGREPENKKEKRTWKKENIDSSVAGGCEDGGNTVEFAFSDYISILPRSLSSFLHPNLKIESQENEVA
uniref:Uncharacterized protein n=1 Tax=Vespula pensylvanica TaxID=30213 RepID=A0A834U8N0_VESPE|nr:hypothetical protein H0235_009849 [Vespula pensylvanica]